MNRKWLTTAAAPMLLMAGQAHAAITLDPSPPAGTFGNSTVTCATGTTNCMFSDTTTFVTPSGFNQVSASLISGPALSTAQDLIFGTLGLLSGVTLNGQMFNLITSGSTDVATLGPINLTPGATNTLVVSGIAGQSGAGSYAGTLQFGNVAAVPEPATWATMLMGLGAIGWMMRRKKALSGAGNLALA